MHTAPAPPRSFEEWYTQPIVQPVTSSAGLGWTAVDVRTSYLHPAPDYSYGPLSDQHFLVLVLNGATEIKSRLNGKTYHEYQTAGSMHLYPAGEVYGGQWFSSIYTGYVAFSPRLITRLAETAFQGDPDQVELIPILNFRDPLISHLIFSLCEILRAPSPLSAVFAESVAQTMMLHLLRKYSNKTVRQAAPARGGFSERQRRVIDDYIESHEDAKISLAELASLLFMSVSHFERVFRQTMGCAPYQYVLARRLERAKWLLETSAASVFEVGRLCGFANQSHFTRHFTKRYGVSPARFRYGRDPA